MSDRLEFTLLGEVTLHIDGQPIKRLPSRKAEALLVYLAYTKRPCSRELLADFLWDDRPPEQALANLRSLLSGLRRQFKPYLMISRQTIAFKEDSDYWLDTSDFTSLAAADEIPKLEEAMRLYRADFLAGFDIRDSRGFEEWMILERERLQRTAVTVLRRLIQHHHEQGNYESGIEYAARLLALSPLSEWAHRQLMLLLARNDQRTEALQQYQTCCDILADELGIDPAPETTTLYERIRGAVSSRHQNLPAVMTPFVGRRVELAQIQSRLAQPDCRLLTLAGPGGIGKSRLALQVARIRSRAYLNGVCFVPLAAVATPDLIVPAIGEALNFAFAGTADPKTQLFHYLETKEMLLVLDNFEHLLPDVDLLVDMVQTVPDVKIIVTSRERLNMQSEWTYDVTGLPLPNGDLEQARQIESVQLFEQAAGRAQKGFLLSADDLPAAVRICRLVEGIPLGIELASTWVRQLSCAEIAREIERSIGFLRTRAGDVPPRHRSLQAVFEHSWLLLTDEEQQVLCQLAVFRGGFRRQAAEQVAGASLWTLSALVDKSLLQRNGNGRYHILESVRQFAAEKLAERSHKDDTVPARHATHYATLLRQQASYWHTPQRQQILALLLPEIENIRAAWLWAVSHTAVSEMGQMLLTLFHIYESRGWFQEGAAAFGWAIASLSELPERSVAQDALYGRLLVQYGRFSIYLGQYERAKEVLEEALTLLQPQAAHEELSLCEGYLGIIALIGGDYEQAGQRAEASLELTQALDNQPGIAFGLNLRGNVAQRRGEYEQAKQYFEASLAIRRQLGDQYGTAVTLNNLGNLANARHEYAVARKLYEECQLIFKQINHRPGRAAALTNAGVVAGKLGEPVEAKRLLEESLIIKRELGNRRSLAISLINLGEVTCSTGEVLESRRAFLEALRLAMAINALPLTVDIIVGMAPLRIQQGEQEAAIVLLALAQHHPAATSEVRERAAHLLAELGDAVTDDLIEQGKGLDLETAVAEMLSA